MKRRTAITAAGALGAAAVAAAPALAAPASAQPAFLRGADISSLAKSEDYGGVYMWSDGWREDAVWILSKSGVNCIRLKVWVDPADGYNNKHRVVEIGRRVKAAGMDLLIDFHYSDFWTDPGKQYKPAAWTGLDFEGLKDAVYGHTADVLGALNDAGAAPGHVQVGNELNGGMLWPEGRYDRWGQLAELLTAGSNAVRDTVPGAEVVLHLAEGGNNGAFRWFFDNCENHGVPYDAIGASYYPYWHGPLSGLRSNLHDLAWRYGKPLYVVETAYPFGTEDRDGHANIVSDSAPVPGYRADYHGQADMLWDIAQIVKNVPNGLGRGVFWWEATWTAVEGNGWDPTDPSSGNAWENQALFGYDWRVTWALDTLGKL